MKAWLLDLWGRTQSPPAGSDVLGIGGLRPERAIQEGRDLRLLAYFASYAKPEWHWLLLALILMPLMSALGLLQPWLIKQAVDAALVEESLPALLNVVGFFALVIAGEFVVRFAQTYALQYAGQRAVARLRLAVFSHLQRLHVRVFDGTPLGRLVTRLTTDVDNLGELFASGAITAFTDLLTVALVVVFMVAIDWELSIVALLSLPPMLLFVTWLRRRARDAYREIRTKISVLNAHLAEQVSGLPLIRSLAVGPDFALEYRAINQDLRGAYMRSIRYDALLYSVVESIAAASIAATLAYAAARLMGADALSSALTVGTVVAFYEYIQRFFTPIRDLATKYTVLQSALASAERIHDLLSQNDLDPGVARQKHATSAQVGVRAGAALQPAALPLPAAAQPPEVRFEGVGFAYVPGQTTLEDVSFAVAPGQVVAIVGATGSGKSTLMSLVLRFFDPSTGRITLGGVDLGAMPTAEARAHFAYVPQSPYLVAGTLAENLALGSATPDDGAVADVMQRLAAAGVGTELLGALGDPNRPIEEGGANLSAGQRQLVAMLRALATGRPFVLLDEATASLDSETEAQLDLATARVLAGKSALIIAHRLSTIQTADRILVMHAGRLAEAGTHAELLARGGLYTALHRLHFQADTRQADTRS